MRSSFPTACLLLAVAAAPALRASTPESIPLDEARRIVEAMQQKRVETVARVLPSVVCVFDRLERGGGSGVLIDEDGYGLTNFHVVAGLLDTRRGLGGLGDGILYELEVLGIDVTGDVAMFRLLPPKTPYRFPHARLGDSDRVRLGDDVLAMGNPFTLSEDYLPTVTHGIVTGVHRYQEGVRGNLIYTDCIQVDASINPGNSGGPLFNETGEVIGINGRISLNTRGRFNVGFGYAISSNQIKRFIPALRAGLLARHGTWEATVEETIDGRIVFDQVGWSGPAQRAGIRSGDELIGIDGVRIRSVNQVLSLMGTYPGDWPVLVRVRRHGRSRERIVRLTPVEPNLRKPFLPDPEVNRRAVERVLKGYRAWVFGEDGEPGPIRGRWRVRREFHPVGDDDFAPLPQTLIVSFTKDGWRVEREDESGTATALDRQTFFLNTEAAAVEEPPGDPAWSGTDRRVLTALYHAWTTLLQPAAERDDVELEHAGGDALVTAMPEESLDLRPLSDETRIDWPVLEVLQMPIDETWSARYEFDAVTFEPARITLVPVEGHPRIEILLSEPHREGDVRLPAALEVRGEQRNYCDEWSRLEP
ncbi:MAG: PDZ domain-containing protein [Planctomycetota bacterium]|nr:MAG: PDZ domain-containing protein [Planctomycetota bacterium]